MPTKKFDNKLYKDSDPISKEAMSKWLSKHGYTHINPEETYGVDIVCKKEDIPSYFETEIKYGWKEEWPNSWKEIRIPHRKKRLLDRWKKECYNDLLTFVIFKNDCTQAWHIDGETVLNSEVKEASNRVIRKGELFFHIPVTDAYLVDMEYESNS